MQIKPWRVLDRPSPTSPSRFGWRNPVAAAVAALALAVPPAVTLLAPVRGDTPLTETEKAAFFDKQVAPILKANCYSCHGESADNISGGLNMLTRAGLLKGGDSGPSVSLAKPEGSLLVHAINYDGRQMPPTGKLPAAQIAVLTRWVNMGAPYPAALQGTTPAPGAATTPARKGPPPVNAETMRWWSFQPVKAVAVPKVKNKTWVRNPVDSFVLARLEKAGLTPAPPASKTALLRRASYDLTGLPPSPADVRAFLADTSPNAYEKVVDRLLASPAYGEKWARHWLDLVRYAETNSFERDDPKPFAWRYRDYVIQSLNSDKPYDRFIREQIAGDELDHPTPETLVATGYYRLGQWDDEPSDPLQARYDELDDIVATTGQTFLGMTVNCARCHDHKIDPIPQKDYYRLLAFFQGTTRYAGSGKSVAANSLRSIAPPDEQAANDRDRAAYEAAMERVGMRLKTIETVARPTFSPVETQDFAHQQNRLAIIKKHVPDQVTPAQYDEYVTLTTERDSLLKAPPPSLAQALCVTEEGRDAPPTFVCLRGSPHAPGDKVEPGFPSVLAPPAPRLSPLPAGVNSSGRRRALADWLASPTNPLTARVMVNRVWQHHFGRGIVRSTSNFGFAGTAPTHPELLDYLATQFVRNGWRLKPLHRMLMLSSTYRMSAQADKKALARDPENDLVWRFDMRRLDAEEVRDSMLAVNGTLNDKRYGPDIYPTIPAEVLAGQSRPGYGWPTSPESEQTRRSVYIHIKRSLTVPLLASFDVADTDSACPVRFATTQPTQALTLLNSTFSNQQAALFAALLEKSAPGDAPAQVRLALSRTLQRPPTVAEVKRGLALIASLEKDPKVTPHDALCGFCLMTLNLNEFLYLD